MKKIGEKINLDIEFTNTAGEQKKLSDYLEEHRYLVLYFYPKDNTPGCTQEACNFRDFNSEIRNLGANILGVSSDSMESHQKFENKHELNFDLAADIDKKIHEEFGTWGEKSMYGKKYMGTFRVTFLINSEGEIVHVWEKVKTKNHAEEVLNFLKQL